MRDVYHGMTADVVVNVENNWFQRIGYVRRPNGIMFLIIWKNCLKADMVPAIEPNIKCLQEVIKLYERHLSWYIYIYIYIYMTADVDVSVENNWLF